MLEGVLEMWPRETDDFEPDHFEAEGDDRGEALYFVFNPSNNNRVFIYNNKKIFI